ncbi:MAG: SsrA-binding protein SmpB [Clostridiaceae bacterium]|jgi:SsrA-binding protein|nr:SsrA-binding protein SmpB [Clostridiaceae bacterium]
MAASAKGIKIITDNRKAFHEYFILERLETGIELAGTEVKSIRNGHVNLGDSYAAVDNGELWLHGMHISPYEQGNRFNKDPLRTRRLLAHKREIARLYGRVKQDGLTLVPTRLYFLNGRVKVEIALAKGKKNYDKRDAEAKRESDRVIAQRIKTSRRDD